MLIQADKPIRLQYSHQIDLFDVKQQLLSDSFKSSYYGFRLDLYVATEVGLILISLN
jgi:hypothetical protein